MSTMDLNNSLEKMKKAAFRIANPGFGGSGKRQDLVLTDYELASVEFAEARNGLPVQHPLWDICVSLEQMADRLAKARALERKPEADPDTEPLMSRA